MTQTIPSDAKIKKRLTNKAMHYLGRYASTTSRLRQVLQKFAARKLETVPAETLAPAIDAVIADCQKFGYVDDDAFIQMRIRTGRKAGQSERQILNRLQQAGIDRDSASESLKAHRAESGDAERLAALIHIRKKRLGPYTKEADDAQALFQKQMAKLARAGFSLDIIKSILALNSIEEAEELEAQYQCEQSF